MARTPVLAAGGIVLRRETPPRFAVVRLRKRNEWVLPKGKLDDGETARDAAEREVLEETGHDVEVHEFLGTLVYDSGGRSKVVHYWRMDAGGKPVRALMSDIREVDWLPLDAALERLSRSYERTFLENVGPIALQAAANAERERRAQLRVQAAERRRSRAAMAPPVIEDQEVASAPDFAEVPVPTETPAIEPVARSEPDTPAMVPEHAVADVGEVAEAEQVAEAVASEAPPSSACEIAPPAATVLPTPRKNLIERVRDWLRRAA
ncbi:NUDIX hydrolase [Bradyrhizobium acaciae]|uniref:NUDIX hydrolase n=1 Tax=Bradyrhizobium acaciae TaxID=2683706 RepID=UPI001E2FAE65|nr:NUDIX hydrolase [Bradyrhizobium acaciae]MCC8983306.1 NUDIX domain-containing protein [Bradyrhizobium acaciae]